MRKAFVVLFVFSLVFMMVACKSGPSASVGPGPVDVPDWLNDMPPEDALWGIGQAKQTSSSMSMNTAEIRARVSIARQLDQKVQDMFVDYNLDAGNVSNLANSSMQENVSRLLTNTDLSGARPIRRWQAKDGTWWLLVEYKKSDARAKIAGILGNEEAQYAQFKAQQALQMMDAQFAKPSKPTVVSE